LGRAVGAQPLEAAADQAVCGDEAREDVKALLVANEFLARDRRESFARISVSREARALRHHRLGLRLTCFTT
jgi:hypothetical protein